MTRKIGAIALSSLILSACSMQQAAFPSLAKRAIESQQDIPESEAPAVQILTKLPDSLARRVKVELSKSDAAHLLFKNRLPAVTNLVESAKGAAVSSEPWVSAQLALSTLDADRADSVSALATLDDLHVRQIQQEAANGSRGGAALIAELRARTLQQVTEQNSILQKLMSRLPEA